MTKSWDLFDECRAVLVTNRHLLEEAGRHAVTTRRNIALAEAALRLVVENLAKLEAANVAFDRLLGREPSPSAIRPLDERSCTLIVLVPKFDTFVDAAAAPLTL
jgi:hypothetical protein